MRRGYLAVAGRDTTGVRPPIQTSIRTPGAIRLSAVRALLARSITMTAFEIERRVRTRLRRPDTRAPDLTLFDRTSQREAARARYESHVAKAAAARSFLVVR